MGNDFIFGYVVFDSSETSSWTFRLKGLARNLRFENHQHTGTREVMRVNEKNRKYEYVGKNRGLRTSTFKERLRKKSQQKNY